MSVDDWARREADKAWAWEEPAATAYVQGIVHVFSALLSDEAVEAAARAICDEHNAGAFERYRDTWLVEGRAALQAAVDAVTKEARND